jgi:tetratricopeptide (TPR) repeat protein
MVHSTLGNVARNIGDIEGAKRHYEDAIDLARSVKDTKYELFILLKLAELEFQIGNIDRAVDLGSALLRGVRQDPQGGFLTSALANLTAYILARSNTVAARPYAEDFFTTSKTVGGYELRISIMQWALIGALEGHFANAALLAGFVDNGFKCGGEFKEPTEKHTYDQLKRLLNSAIPAAEHQALEAEGASWTEDEAAGFVLSRLISPEGPEAR